MSNKVSVKQLAKSAAAADNKARSGGKSVATADSFQNLAHKLGIGTDNPMSGSTYGYNPISRNRNLLEWIHRGSWIAGSAIDLVANDMTRAGVELKGNIKPEGIEALNYAADELGIWNVINDTIKWGRLYGGAIAVMLIDGQAMNRPLRIETVGKESFKGLLCLDRWQVTPSTEDLVTDLGPSLGTPKLYTVQSNAPALRGQKIHHTRVIRMDGVKLPYQQALTENLWSISVLERLYDRLVGFDSAFTGAAQLIYKSYLRTLKVKDLRELTAIGGPALDGLVKYIGMMARFQSIEGVTLIDGEDDFAIHQNNSFGGIADIMAKFGEQLSGALEIPVVRLFGTSPGGLNASGDSDIRTYYDGIQQKQRMSLGVGVTRLYKIMAASIGVKIPADFKLEFRSLWQLQEKEKSEISKSTTDSVIAAKDAGLVSQATAMKELKQQSHTTGLFSNISDEDIANANDEPELPNSENVDMNGEAISGAPVEAKPGKSVNRDKSGGKLAKKDQRTKDSIEALTKAQRYLGLEIAIENPKGSIRRGSINGVDWETVMPYDYGYVRKTKGADGDQVDVCVGPHLLASDDVYVIDQRDLRTGMFDEHKVMLGYLSREEAMAAYNAGYSDNMGPERVGSVTEYSIEQFRGWLNAADTTRPCSGRFEAGVAI